ncbi:MAG: restriction endonuclease [Betaproteobacteria bacterium]|nr:restriction endonuclease [Betaproteobacteria bacterium]
MPRSNRREKTGWLDVLSLLPWWACLVLAVLSYLVLHWLAGERPDPQMAGKQPAQFIMGSFLQGLAIPGQYVLPFLFVIAGLMSGARAMTRRASTPAPRSEPQRQPPLPAPSEPGRDLYDVWKDAGREEVPPPQVDTSRWNLDLLKALDWKRFELVCAGYFEELGFRAETVRGGPDGGVDVHLFANDSRHPAIIVQCKAWRSWAVGVGVVRELLGVMTAADVKEGIIATTSTFTTEAKSFALGKEIHLIEGEDLVRKLRDLAPNRQKSLIEFATEGDYWTPTCPSCGIGTRMVMRTSGKDGARFWRCEKFPACRSTMQASRAQA